MSVDRFAVSLPTHLLLSTQTNTEASEMLSESYYTVNDQHAHGRDDHSVQVDNMTEEDTYALIEAAEQAEKQARAKHSSNSNNSNNSNHSMNVDDGVSVAGTTYGDEGSTIMYSPFENSSIFKGMYMWSIGWNKVEHETLNKIITSNGGMLLGGDEYSPYSQLPECINFIIAPHGCHSYKELLHANKDRIPVLPTVVSYQWVTRCVEANMFVQPSMSILFSPLNVGTLEMCWLSSVIAQLFTCSFRTTVAGISAILHCNNWLRWRRPRQHQQFDTTAGCSLH
jgi:hypothetical protein